MNGGRFSWFNATSLTLGFAFLYLPMLVLVIYSFNESRLVTVWAGFSTKWYGELLQNDAFLDDVAAWWTALGNPSKAWKAVLARKSGNEVWARQARSQILEFLEKGEPKEETRTNEEDEDGGAEARLEDEDGAEAAANAEHNDKHARNASAERIQKSSTPEALSPSWQPWRKCRTIGSRQSLTSKNRWVHKVASGAALTPRQ